MVQPPRDVRPLLRAAAPRARLLDSVAQLAGYDADGLGYKSFPPDLVVIPSDADELAAVVRVLHEAGVPICLRGAGTSLGAAAWAAVAPAETRFDTVTLAERLEKVSLAAPAGPATRKRLEAVLEEGDFPCSDDTVREASVVLLGCPEYNLC